MHHNIYTHISLYIYHIYIIYLIYTGLIWFPFYLHAITFAVVLMGIVTVSATERLPPCDVLAT